MPTVLRLNGYRFGFFSADGDEPPHLHVSKAGAQAKFWLRPVGLADNHGFRRHELREVETILTEHQTTLLQAWHDYFG